MIHTYNGVHGALRSFRSETDFRIRSLRGTRFCTLLTEIYISISRGSHGHPVLSLVG